MKLRARLIAAGILLISAVVVAAGFAYVHGREQALLDAEDSAEDLARALERHTFVVTRGIDRGLSVLSERVDVAALEDPGQRAFFHQLLDRWARADPALAAFLILDRNGVVLHRSNTADFDPTDNSDRSYFTAHRDDPGAGLVIGEPLVARAGPTQGRPTIAFSRRLSASDGSFAGVVVATVATDSLRDFNQSLNVGRNGIVSLLRRDGLMLARSPADPSVVGRRFDTSELFRTQLANAEHGTYRARFPTDNVHRIVAYRSVPQYPLIVTVSVAQADVIAAWGETAAIGASALLTLVAAVILLLLWLWGASKREAASTHALAVNEARARSTLETLSDGVITIDAGGIVRSFNPAAERMFGFTAADVIGGSADRLLGFGGLSDIREWLSTAGDRPDSQRHAAGARRREIEATRSDGTHFPAELRFGIARGDPDLGDQIIVTVRDLSEEKALQHQFQQSQKLEVIGHLTGGIAHDFGNVLAGVTTNLESAMRQLPPGAVAREQIDSALQASRSGREIVQRLIAFARRQPLNPCSSDLNQLITGCMALLCQGRGSGIKIKPNLSGGLAPILVDRSGLENAVLNLVINASDAMPDGGTILLETGQVTIGAGRAAEWGIKAGEYATLAVRDNGRGMTSEVRSRMFEPFFSTKRSGTGLGLSMVQGFVTQSGGHVEVESAPGAGTTVTMFFPMQRGRQASLTEWFSQLGGAAPQQSAGRSILVVEDNAFVREGLIALLGHLGHRTIMAADAESAALLLDRHPEIELLLTDIGLPGMSGRQLARLARARRPTLKVLFVTGYDTVSTGERPIAEVDAGTGLLTKPFFEEDLAREIERLFRTSPPQSNGGRPKSRANGTR